jgi:preprotein translocase subunit SecG
MHTVVLVLFVLTSVTLIGVVLIQQGKGADAGAAFGSGASATVFGSRGSSSFLSRFTAVLATIFFSLAILLAYMGQQVEAPQSLTERMPLTDYSAEPEQGAEGAAAADEPVAERVEPEPEPEPTADETDDGEAPPPQP